MGKRFWIVVLGFVAAVVVLGALVMTKGGGKQWSECLVCRAKRTNDRFLGFPLESLESNTFTDWHKANRPPHQHVWICTGGH